MASQSHCSALTLVTPPPPAGQPMGVRSRFRGPVSKVALSHRNYHAAGFWRLKPDILLIVSFPLNYRAV